MRVRGVVPDLAEAGAAGRGDADRAVRGEQLQVPPRSPEHLPLVPRHEDRIRPLGRTAGHLQRCPVKA